MVDSGLFTVIVGPTRGKVRSEGENESERMDA